MILRKATLDDMALLTRLRIDYLTEDRGGLSEDEETAVRSQLRTYFTRHIPNNTFIAILAEDEGEALSVAYLAIAEKPANPSFITGLTGTLLNVLTYPPYRRRGIATKVIEKVIEEARRAGVSSIDLSATPDGKYVYEKLGFKESNYTEMALRLDRNDPSSAGV